MIARPQLDDLCKTCDGFGWNYDRLGARITCPDCSGANVRREHADLPSRWRMTQACRDECHGACLRDDGECTCPCHRKADR